ncbi:MAG: SDR family oxidoreductase [Sphingomonadales bacterium]|nr:SDR family oxidoreductase [Sphingomonadales bacterium]
MADEGGKAEAVEADIADSGACERVAALAVERWGAPDILINNVGIGWGGDGPPHRLTEEAFDRILSVNLKGMWLMCRAVLPAMREARSGAIVNISSLASIAGGFQLGYELSKSGVNRLTTSIAQSNASRGIRCNAILPGFIDTPMAIHGIAEARGISTDELREERNARVPLGKRMGTGWDTAHAALFLASDDAGFVTGALLPVDGGMGVRIG